MAEATDILKAIETLTRAIADGQMATIEAQRKSEVSAREIKETKKRLELKNMKTVDFGGEKDKWDEWAFNFTSGIRAQNSEFYKHMIKAEEDKDDFNEENLDPRIEGMSGELYDILAQVCRGSAQATVRAVEGCQGLRAWQRLYRTCNPRTLSRTIQLLGEVTRPPQIKELTDVETGIDNWERNLQKIKKEHAEELSKTLKMAVFTSFMPTVVRDYIYVNVTKDTEYEDLAEKVRVLVRNKAGAKGEAMDMGAVEQPPGLYGGHQDWEDVGAVGAYTKCHNCGGFGHLARECATKGGGKGGGKMFGKGGNYNYDYGKGGKGGNYDYGKGGTYKGSGGKDSYKGFQNVKGGKDFGKGNLKGGKGMGHFGQGGKGYGYQGTCFGCGEVGHKRAECWKAS